MSLASTSIRHPVFAWMMMAAIILVGAISFFKLGVGLMPDVDFPTINISATLEGAAPEIMESEVVDVLEDSVMAVEGIREVSSTSRQGQCTVTVEFEPERDVDLALQDIQSRISASMRLLPKDIDPPSIQKTNPEESPIMWIALRGMRSQQELGEYAKNVLRDRFLTVPDSGDVLMGGYQERNLRLWIDPVRLQALGLTVDEVILAVQREHVEMPAGRIEGAFRESNVKVEGQALNIEAWRNLVIAVRDGSSIQLRDVAVVEDGMADRRRLSRVDGEPAQGFGIIKQHGSNSVKLAEAVRARIAELNPNLPNGMELVVRADSTKFIKEATRETQFTLLLAVVLTALVCWLFLGSFSSTLNVILAIPVSVFGTFAVIYFCGFTLNTFTILAISLSIGLVVDDAIMVLENIHRHAEMGKDRVSAAREGTEQITFAALAATFAIVAIFAPVLFMSGVIGKFFFQFGVVLSAAVLLSLLEALTLAPMRCSQFLKVGERGNVLERAAGWFFEVQTNFYRWTLGWGLRLRYVVLLGSLGIFGASMLLFPKIPKEEVPGQDQGLYQVRIECPIGSSLDYADGIMRKVEAIIASRPELEASFVSIGGFTGEANEGQAFITMKPREERKLTQQQSIDEMRKLLVFPGVKVILRDLSRQGLAAGRGGGLPINFSIRGPDWDKLGDLGLKFTQEMIASGKLLDVSSSYKVGMPEVQVVPNREKTLAQNVDIMALSETVSALIGGNRITRFTHEGHRYDVRVRLLKDDRQRPEDISNLYVRNRAGEPIKLSELVDVHIRPSLQSIQRVNRERSVNISANFNTSEGVSQEEAIQEIERIASDLLPPNYHMVLSGSARSARESFWSLILALSLGVVAAYMILASQFNSFLHPVTVLLALPFSLTGALVALYLFGLSLNVYSMIGLILLMGIVKKNSILLVDFTNQLRNEGKGVNEALREACPVRLRPILMTSVATIAGALPGALSLGPGGELRIPMSIAVVGGVLVSTLLTLFVVPCFYSVAEDWRVLLNRAWHHFFPKPAHAEGPAHRIEGGTIAAAGMDGKPVP